MTMNAEGEFGSLLRHIILVPSHSVAAETYFDHHRLPLDLRHAVNIGCHGYIY